MDPMLQAQLKDWVLMGVFLMMAVWMLILVTTGIRRKHQSTMQKALLDKFSSAHDFAEFMQSPAGQKYLMSFSEAVSNPRNAILNSVRTGFVLAGVGIGFIVSSDVMVRDSRWVAFLIGWVSFLAGTGFLISAAVSYFLAKRTGWKDEE